MNYASGKLHNTLTVTGLKCTKRSSQVLDLEQPVPWRDEARTSVRKECNHAM